MKHLTLFLSVCWFFWFSQIFAISTICGLSDMTAASVIALANNTSELVTKNLKDNIDLPIILSDTEIKNSNQTKINNNENSEFIVIPEVKTKVFVEEKNEETLLNENASMINDSGGGTPPISSPPPKININKHVGSDGDKIVLAETSSSSILLQQQQPQTSEEIISETNLTAEENPIPVFSEWTQRQMEEAEKKQEKQVVNSSASKKNITTGNKPALVKLRVKNYASPDCGAKIIASNSDAQNTGALLSSSKDEYMLSPCTSRIWFVIELCEAIQLEKVDLANFELFSSSPKNFSVSASSRFPTREWSNIGKFVAEDNRNIQSFDLHPHLFGKFIRVDIHSHYNSEHFCPISLFNVYGTSEFEAFETENRPESDSEDGEYDDEDDQIDTVQQQMHTKQENNLFKSASDAVISIVKKAAALVKTNSNETSNEDNSSFEKSLDKLMSECFSLKINFVCETCNQTLVNNINFLLSCKYSKLIGLLSSETLGIDGLISKICAKTINRLVENNGNNTSLEYSFHETLNEKQNFMLHILPINYIVALCHLHKLINFENESSAYSLNKGNSLLNLTIEKKYGNEFINVETLKKGKSHAKNVNKKKKPKIYKSNDINNSDKKDQVNQSINKNENIEINKERGTLEENLEDNLNENLKKSEEFIDPKKDLINSENKETDTDVNIFNLVDKKEHDENSIPSQIVTNSNQVSEKELNTEMKLNFPEKSDDPIKIKEVDTEQGTWDSLDKLLSEQISSESSNSNSETVEIPDSQTPQRVQSESVFIRLSNRIKALERNMSLSGQYLEELSRRYKKQVEELQHSFTKTLSVIEEQNRNSIERENLLTQQNQNLKEVVNEISIRLSSYITLLIVLIPIIFLQIFVSWFFIQSYRRQYLEILNCVSDSSLITKRTLKKPKKLNRRKSVEGIIGQQSTPAKKLRRPSEEAMYISGGSYKDLLIDGDDKIEEANLNEIMAKQRQRKISVFYGKIKDNQSSNRLKSVLENSDVTVSSINSSLPETSVIPDDDYESYVPSSGYVYNEFMPEGPSGEKVIKNNETKLASISTNSKQKKIMKVRKLSTSSKFLKSAFNKHNSYNENKKLPHEATGWEWYRTRKSITNNNNNKNPLFSHLDEANQQQNSMEKQSERVNGFMSSSMISLNSDGLQTTNGSNNSRESLSGNMGGS